MKKLTLIISFFLTTAFAQQDTSQSVDFNFYADEGTGGMIGPVISPTISAGFSIPFGSTELILGARYLPKRIDLKGSNGLKLKLSSHDLLVPIVLHQKLLQKKDHVFSILAGAELVFNTAVFGDTIHPDGSEYHIKYSKKFLNRQVGVNLTAALRYSYAINDRQAVFLQVYFTQKIVNEYAGDLYGGHFVDPPDLYNGYTDGWLIGFHLGWQINLSPRRSIFFTKKKDAFGQRKKSL